MSQSRESLLFLAKLAEQSERFDDMLEYMKKVAGESGELNVDERNMFSVAYKNVIGVRRVSWRIISSLEQKEEARGVASHIAGVREYRAKIEKEMEQICMDVLEILTSQLIPKATSSESKVFYHKMRGDYYRYLAEFMTADRRREVANKSLEAYQEATSIADAELQTTHPLRLGLALNFSVFYFEIMGQPVEACHLAQRALDQAIANLESLSEESYQDSTLIMRLLQDNLTLWTTDLDAPNPADSAANKTGEAKA